MRKLLTVVAAASSVAFVFTAGAASAQALTFLCTESASGGCVQALPVTGSTITAASDGEGVFNPFSYSTDTSDGLQLDAIWSPVQTKGWVQIAGTNTWVVPACDTTGVCENGPVNESVGHWIAHGYTLTVPPINYGIYESNGSLSDIVSLYNDSSGTVNITFNSSVPEPAAWAMMLVGVGAVGAMARRRARVSLTA